MVFAILKFLFICLEVVLLFNLLIVVHELGHFLAARWRGLVVEKFAIWFGKPIWSKTIDGVEYRLGSIPAGGFVAIPQLAPMEALEGKTETDRANLPPVKALDKIIVAAAGPAFSLGLAFVMAIIVWIVGVPVFGTDSTVIGSVKADGPGAVAGLKAGDQILAVDGQPVTHFLPSIGGSVDSVKWRIVRSEGKTIAFEVKRGDQILTIHSNWEKPVTSNWRRPPLRQVDITPHEVPEVGMVIPGSPAAKASLQAGDLVQTADGKAIFDLSDLVPIFKDHAGKPLTLGVLRKGQTIVATFPVPAATQKDPDAPLEIGIDWGRLTFLHPSPLTQVKNASLTIFNMVGALFSHSDIKVSQFSGPLGIMRLYYSIFEGDYGWLLAISFSVMINVNLALINLVPIPVLDGGHILLALIEAVWRRPIDFKVLEVVTSACAMLIIGFIVYVSFFDAGDIVELFQKAL